MNERQPSSMSNRERRRMAKWGSRPFEPSGGARRNLKPFRGLFIALGLIVVAFAAIIVWFALK